MEREVPVKRPETRREQESARYCRHSAGVLPLDERQMERGVTMTTGTTERSGDRFAARVSLAVLLGALAVKGALVVYALDRGFEIGDEGYFLLNLNRPGNAPEPFQFYRLLALLVREHRFDVLDARLLRIGVELAASAALVGGVLAWARARTVVPGTPQRLPFLSFAALGILLNTGSRSFGYNDATNLCVYAAIGALFWLLSLPSGAAGQRRRSGAALLIGLAAGFQLGIKFTSALLLIAMVAASLYLLPRDVPVRTRLRMVPWIGGGLLLAILAYGAVRGGISLLASDVGLLPELARLGGYHPRELVARLALGEIVTLLHLTLTGGAFALSLRLLSRNERRSADGRLAVALGIAAVLLAVDVTLLHPFFLAPSLLFLSVFLLFLVGVGVLALGRRAPTLGLAPSTGPPPRLAPLLVLLATPVVAMAGTNVPLSMRLPAHALPWILAAAVPLFELQRRDRLVRFSCVAATTLALATTTIVVQHQLAHPYGVPGPATEQVHGVRGLEGVRVEAAIRDFLEDLREQMEEAGFRPGDPILALDYMPGLVFFLDGISPGWNFYVFDRPDLNCFNFRRASEPGRPFLLLGRPMPAAQRRCLEGLDLAGGYRLVSEIPFPYQDVYASFGGPGMTHLRVYAPRAHGGAVD